MPDSQARRPTGFSTFRRWPDGTCQESSLSAGPRSPFNLFLHSAISSRRSCVSIPLSACHPPLATCLGTKHPSAWCFSFLLFPCHCRQLSPCYRPYGSLVPARVCPHSHPSALHVVPPPALFDPEPLHHCTPTRSPAPRSVILRFPEQT